MTPHVRSARIVKETSFGSLGADGLPDRSIFDDGGDSIVFDVELASIMVFGEHPQAEPDQIRSGFWRIAPEPETIHDDSGVPVRRRKGQVTFELIMRDAGTADPSTIGLLWAIGSSLTPVLPTARTAAVTTQVGSGQAGFADAIAAASLRSGALVSLMPEDAIGPAAFSQIVAKSSAAGTTTVTLSPLLPKAVLEVADTVRTTASFGAIPGRDPGPSVAYRFDGDGWRVYAFGCRMASLAASGDGQSRIKRATLVLDSAILQAAHSEVTRAAAVSKRPARAAASVPLHTLGAAVTVSSVVTDATGAAVPGGRNVLPVDAWSYTLLTELAPINSQGGILGMDDMEVSRASLDVELTLSRPNPLVADDYLYRRHRSLMMAWGPAPGMALVIPCAFLANDPDSRDLGGQLVRQVLSYREGPPLDITPTTAELEATPPLHLADAAFVLAFGLTTAP